MSEERGPVGVPLDEVPDIAQRQFLAVMRPLGWHKTHVNVHKRPWQKATRMTESGLVITEPKYIDRVEEVLQRKSKNTRVRWAQSGASDRLVVWDVRDEPDTFGVPDGFTLSA